MELLRHLRLQHGVSARGALQNRPVSGEKNTRPWASRELAAAARPLVPCGSHEVKLRLQRSGHLVCLRAAAFVLAAGAPAGVAGGGVLRQLPLVASGRQARTAGQTGQHAQDQRTLCPGASSCHQSPPPRGMMRTLNGSAVSSVPGQDVRPVHPGPPPALRLVPACTCPAPAHQPRPRLISPAPTRAPPSPGTCTALTAHLGPRPSAPLSLGGFDSRARPLGAPGVPGSPGCDPLSSSCSSGFFFSLSLSSLPSPRMSSTYKGPRVSARPS